MYQLIKKILSLKYNAQELQFDKAHLAVFINFLTVIVLGIFTPLNIIVRHNYILAGIEFFFLSLSCFALYTFFKQKNINNFIYTTTFIIFGISSLYFFFIPKHLFSAVWLFFFPFMVFLLNDLKTGRILIGIYIIIILSYIYNGIGVFTDVPGFVNISFSLIIFSFLLYQFELSRRKAYTKLAILMQELEELSTKDALTHLYNRYFLHNNILTNKQLLSQPFLFCISDIDNFKLYNDTYGHQKGDEVLKKVATLKKEIFQNSSTQSYVIRLGGEEFGAFVFNDPKSIQKVELFLHSVQALHIEHKYNTPYNVCTVSIGVVYSKKTIDFDFAKVYQQADEALYEAKKNGKNCMVVKEYL